jgi:tetratricopeptide (TPR) repeat protein
MKTRIITVALMAFGVTLFAQKKEIKKAEKALEKESYSEAMTFLNQAEPMLADADEEYKARFYAAKGQAIFKDGSISLDKIQEAVSAYDKALDIEEGMEQATNGKLNAANTVLALATEDYKAQRFSEGAKKYYMTYKLSPVDTSFLYNAAILSVSGNDLESALKYYKELESMNYDGSEVEYTAINKETGEVETFQKDERDLAVRSGQYIKPEDKKSESKKPEIIKNIALIYNDLGKSEEAIAAVEKAMEQNPNDVALMQVEANVYYEMGNMERYKEIMEKVVEQDPNNSALYYNLGISSSKLGDSEAAIGYFKKAAEIDPKNTDAKINIAAEILKEEKPLVEQMNALGTSNADFKKYDELKERRKQIYLSAVPYLESVIEQKPENVEATRVLMNIYYQLDNEAKAKEMKAKLQSFEGN